MAQSSPLSTAHQSLNAKMAEFAGWEMPIFYQGIVAEHQAVRSAVGVFDISHMGQLIVAGANAPSWLDSMLTNDIQQLTEDGQGQYTLMLNEAGGVIDDLIIYREAADRFFLVINASKIAEDHQWLTSHLPDGMALQNLSEAYGGLAVQGPEAVALWEKLDTGCPLPERNGIARDTDFIVCRTGYTGEDGYELFAPVADIGTWWQRILDAGAAPCGLGARDTLRLEKGFPLNGNDLDSVHTPLEAGLGFFTKLKKSAVDFVGRSALEAQQEAGLKERLVAISLLGKAPPPRHDYDVLTADGKTKIGQLSSGSLSPTLGKGIGMAYLPADYAKIGTKVQIGIRQRTFEAEVVKKPFV